MARTGEGYRKLMAHTLKILPMMIACLCMLCGPSAVQADEGIIGAVRERGVIKIGLSVFAPWAMRDKTGDLVGFELDVGRKLAEDMGVDAEFVATEWNRIIPDLNSGKFDVIISGMSITPARQSKVDFTDPYAYSGITLLANRAKTEGLDEAGFNSPDIVFAARRGSTPAAAITEAFPKAALRLFDEDGAAVREVLKGRAHATLDSEPSPTRWINQYPERLYKPLDKTYMPTAEGFALRKGDEEALRFFNDWIAVRWQSGFLDERQAYWFRSLDWEKDVAQ
jgi:polar amino acid transport system substrate-binding protein